MIEEDVNPLYKEKMPVEFLINQLENQAKALRDLPAYVKFQAINHWDLEPILSLLAKILKEMVKSD